MITLTAVFQIGQPLQAATVYWDINGATAGASDTASATGTWDATNAFWNNAAGTGAGAVWASGNIAVFSAGTNATGASAITVSGTQDIGGLVFEDGTVSLSGGTLNLTQNAVISVATGLTATLSSDLTGAFNLTKSGAGTLDYQGNGSGLTGAVAVNGGTLKLSGNGVLTSATDISLSNRGILTLDNTATNLADRVAAPINSSGGTLNFTHAGAAGTNYTETFGTLTLNSGALTINTSLAASGQNSVLTIPSLVRNAGGTLYVNGSGMGGNTRNQVIFNSAPALTNNLVPYIVVNNGTVTRLATHGGNNTSLVPQTTGYTATQGSWTTAAINALPTADQNLSANRLAFTLTLDNGIDVEAGTSGSTDRLLTIGNGVIGMVLQTGGTSEIRNRTGTTADAIIDFGTAEGIFHTIGNLNLVTSGGNNIRGSNGFTKSGPGTLSVQINVNTGLVRLNEGVYRITGSSTSGLGAAAAGVEFNGGGLTFAHTANVSYVAAGAMTMNADTTITVDRSASGAGVVYTLPGALTIGSQTLTVVKGSLITADSAYGLTLSNTAVGMTLTGSPTFFIDNNGTGAGVLTVGNVNSSGGSNSIRKTGSGSLITSGTTGFQHAVEIVDGLLGWSNNTATTLMTETGVISGAGGLIKTGLSTVNLTGTNTFAGPITIAGGALQAQEGVGVPATSNLLFNGGVFQTSGTFTRSLGTGAGQVQWAAGASGGFAAAGGPLTVTLAGTPAILQWDLASFVSGAGALAFGSGTADNVVTFTHDIDLNQTGTALSRTFSATDNTTTTADKAVLSGILSNSGAAGGITKTGNGVLELSGVNTFSGPVTVTLGTLQYSTYSNNGTPSNLGQGIDNISLGGGSLSYIGGSNLTFARAITLTAASTLDASATGGAVLTIQAPITGNFGLALDGTGTGIFSSTLAQTGTTIDLTKNGTGTWTLTTNNTIADDILVNGGTLNVNSAQTVTDDFVITGTTTVVNINAATAFTGDDVFLRGALMKLGVNNAISNAMDDFNISTDVLTGGTLDIAGTTGFAPTDILLGNVGFSGNIIDSVGGGTFGATGTLSLRDGAISANLTGAGSIAKITPGTVTLSGANATYTGSSTLTLGTLALDYTTNNGEKLNAVTVNGGTLLLNGSASAATAEALNSLTITAGGGHVTVNNGSGQTATLNLNGIVRTAVGGTVDFVMSSPSAVIQTSTANSFGTILGGYATVGGAKFATVSGGAISGLDSTVKNDVSTWGVDEDVTDSTGYTGTVGSSLRINSLRFDAAGVASNAAISPGSLLQIRSGGILVTGNVGTGAASLSGGRVMSGNNVDLIIHHNNTGADFTISSGIIGYGLTKSGLGTLVLSGDNFYSGQTNVNEGTLRVSGGNGISDLSAVVIKNGPGALLALAGNEAIGTLAGGGTDGGVLDIGANTLTINSTANSTYSGLVSGTGVLIKAGPSTLTFNTSANSFSGALVINQGQVTLADRTDANFAGLTGLVLNTGTLLLDFAGGTEGSPNKIGTAVVALVNTGGVDGLRANNDRNDASKAETVGDMTLVAGANTITVQENASVGTTARQMTITAATLTRSNGATLLVRGNNLGDLGAAVINSGRVVITAAPTGVNFVGGSGTAGTTTINIVPWAIGSSTATGSTAHGTGNSFVTYAATTGFRPLVLDTEYEQLVAAGGVTVANNVRYSSAAGLALDSSTARTMNALLVDNTAASALMTLDGAGASLNVNSGAFLFTGSAPIRLTNINGITTGTPNEYVLHVTNTSSGGVSIDAAFQDGTATRLTKSGAGTLILDGFSGYTGVTTVNQGVLQISNLGNLGNGGGGGLVLNGGTLRFGAAFDLSAITVTLGLTSAVTNVTTTTGGTLDTGAFDITLSSAIGNNGNGGLSKIGTGSLTLNAPVAYTGITSVNEGTLRYGVADALPASMNVSLGGGTLDTAGFTTSLNNLTVAGNSTITATAPLAITGNVLVDGAAARTLTLNNTALTSFTGSMLALTSTGTTAQLFSFAGNSNINVTSQVTNGTAAGSGLNMAGTGTLTLAGPLTYTGFTNIDNGTMIITTDHSLAGGLRFGSANTVTTTGTLDMTNVSLTFGGASTVQTNSTSANNIIIGAGKTLTINNNFSLASNVDGATTVLNMTGGGAFVVNGASFSVGVNTAGTSNSSKATLDMSALSSFTANLTGTFAVQLTGDNNTADTSTAILSNGANNITATTFGVGVSATGGTQTLVLGAGTNVIHANTVNLGTGSRDAGNVTFGANPTGSIVIRDMAGTGRATFNMGTGGATTAAVATNVFDVTGHNADLLLGVVTIGTQAGRTGALTNTFSFNQGTLDMTSLTLGSKGSAGTVLTTATFNIGGGTVLSGPIVMATTTTATGTVVANLNITGGDVTLSGDITKGGGAGNDTANFLLSGNSTVLNMSGFVLGGTGENALDSAVFEGGILRNLGELNGGGTLLKTTAGILILDGTSGYTGGSDFQEGTVIATGGRDNRLGNAAVSLGAGTTSATLQLGSAAGPSNQTVASLATVGTGTANALVGGNAAFSTLTVNQNTTTLFNGTLGGAGANQNNLHLVKDGTGDLVIGKAATLAGTVTVTGGKLFFDGFAGASTTLTSLSLADGTEFSLRGTSSSGNSIYNFSGTGNVVTVGSTTGATLGFALDGIYNTRLNLAAGQTLTLNGTLDTAIYVNNAPTAGLPYVLINGTDDNSIFASGNFNLNPVVFNGGSFTYSLSKVTAGPGEQWVLTPAAQPASPDVWWKGDLTGLGTGVWSASTTSGTGAPTNWDTTQTGGIDAQVPPDSGSIVHFSANGAMNFSTTLGANLTIQELIFHAGGSQIFVGSSGGTNTLTLGNGTDASGLSLLTGAPSVSFSANIALAQAQAWNIADFGTVLNLSGSLSGVGPLSINNNGTSSGTIIVSGANGLLTYSGGTTLGGGVMILEGGVDDRLPTTGSLTMGSATQGAQLQLGDSTNGASNTTIGSLNSGTSTDSAIYNGATAYSTLTVNQTTAGTFHGVLGGGGTDQNNLHLVKTGSATLTLNNANTYLGTTTIQEGTLQLGAAGSIAQTASLALNANAGATATLDINGRTVVLLGGLTLGGADSLAMAQITDTAGGGTITLGGNLVYNPLNAPLGSSITAHLDLGAASRTFTVDDSASATTELAITGNITTNAGATTTGAGLTLTGTGTGSITGNINLLAGTTDGSTSDLIKTGTGTWSIQGALTSGDDLSVTAGTLNLLAGTTVVVDDIVNDNAGVVMNIFGDGTNPTLVGNSGTSNGLYGRSGAVINILANNVTGPLMDFLILGDDGQGLGTLNLNNNTMFMPRIDLGFDGAGEMGVITGTGSITGLTALNLDNGSISVDLVGVGNIDKDNQVVTLSGNNALTGTTLVREGTLILDFATNNGADSKIGTGGLTMGTTTVNDGRAVLSLSGNSTAASLQTVGALTVAGGPSQIDLVSNGGQDVTLRITGALTRTAGTLNLNAPTAGTRFEYTGTTGNTNDIVGAWMTINDQDFVTISGGLLQAASYTVENNAALWLTNANISNAGGGFSGTVTAEANTINSLRLDAAGASTINVAGMLILSSGGILETANVGANASTITGGGLISGSGFLVVHQNNTAGTLTIASNLLGGAQFTKNGAGVVVLSGTNATGAITIDEGILRITGGRAISDNSAVAIRNVAGAGLELMASQTETIGTLTGDGPNGQIILNAGSVLTVTQAANATFAGVVSGSGTFLKVGGSTLTMTGASTMTGTIRIDQGQISLSGTSLQFATATAIILNGTGALLDTQDQTSTTSINRINNSATILLNNTAAGAGLQLTDSEATADNAETVGALTLGAGHNVITSTSSVAANVGTLTFASLAARNNRATVLVRGAALGDSTATQRGQIIFTAAPAGGNVAVGGGGAAGTTNISIFPWIVGDAGVAGLGSSFVRNTGTTNGLKPLTTAEYINNSTSITGTLTDNIRYTASAAITATPTAINSLVLDSGSNIALTGSAGPMEITSGAILAAGAGSHSIGAISALTTGGGRDYTVYVTTAAGILTISTPLTSAVPLVKSGAGTLSLTAAGTGNAFTDVYLNHGTVLADDLDRLGTGTLRFFGGTLKLAAGWTDDLSTKTLDINTGGGTLDVAAVTAGVTLVNGLDDSTVNAADTLNIFTRATGTGTTGQLTINGSSSYTGTVVFRNSGINGGSVNGVVLNGDTNAAINGNVEIGNVTNINDTFDVVVALGASEQIVDTASITFRGASGENAYFKLMGFTETVAGISDTTREGVIENVENAEAGVTTTGKLIVDSSNDYSYNAYLRNRGSGSNANLLEFEKRGTGTQTLIGDRITYTGTTTISGGTLAIQDVTNWASAIVNDSVLNINQTTGSRTHAQAISGTGSVLKTGTGTVVLSGTNSYAGQTSIQQGVLSFSASNNLGDDAPTNSIRLENNATLQSTGANVDLGTNRSVTFGGTGGTVEVVGTGRLTAPGALVGEERHTLTKTGDGALVLSNTDNGTSFRGATQVNAGILQAGAGGFGSTGTGSVTLASGTTLAGSGLVHGTTVISTGAVLQPGDVNTVGTAATTLTSMHIMHFSASGPALTVQDGGQIRLGIGSTPTYVSTGVIDAAANGTYTNALAYITANGAEFTSNWNVIPANATDMDFINLAGGGSSLSIGNRATGTFGDGSVLVSVLGTAQNGQVFNLIDWQGLTGINGNFDTGGSLLYDGNGNVIAGDLDLGALGAGLAWDVSAFAQYGILVVVAVPEPSRALLLLCGLLGLLMRRRRRA